MKQSETTPGVFALESDSETSWGKAAKLTYTSSGKTNNSWYKAAIGYNHVKPVYVGEGNSIYKVTLKIKSNKNELDKISPLVFTCKSKNSDHYTWSFAASTNPTSFNKDKGATTVSKTPTTENKWEDFTFYIDFSLISETVGSIPGNDKDNPKKFEDSSAADVASGFDLRIYTNSNSTDAVDPVNATIYISDVTMEPYQE